MEDVLAAQRRYFDSGATRPLRFRREMLTRLELALTRWEGELLEALKHAGVRTAIVSTKPGDTIRRIFDHLGRLDLLDLVVGGDEVQHAKPNPEGLRLALEKLGLQAEQVLFCGDTVIDAATAQAGRCRFCAVLNGTTGAPAFERFPCVHIAPDLMELKTWLNV